MLAYLYIDPKQQDLKRQENVTHHRGIGGAPTNWRRRADHKKLAAAPTNCRQWHSSNRNEGNVGAILC